MVDRFEQLACQQQRCRCHRVRQKALDVKHGTAAKFVLCQKLRLEHKRRLVQLTICLTLSRYIDEQQVTSTTALIAMHTILNPNVICKLTTAASAAKYIVAACTLA